MKRERKIKEVFFDQRWRRWKEKPIIRAKKGEITPSHLSAEPIKEKNKIKEKKIKIGGQIKLSFSRRENIRMVKKERREKKR